MACMKYETVWWTWNSSNTLLKIIGERWKCRLDSIFNVSCEWFAFGNYFLVLNKDPMISTMSLDVVFTRKISAMAVGNIMEWYDFAIYGNLAGKSQCCGNDNKPVSLSLTIIRCYWRRAFSTWIRSPQLIEIIRLVFTLRFLRPWFLIILSIHKNMSFVDAN